MLQASMLIWYIDQLQSKFLKQTECCAQLEIQLLLQQAQHLEQLLAVEQHYAEHLAQVSQESMTAMQAALKQITPITAIDLPEMLSSCGVGSTDPSNATAGGQATLVSTFEQLVSVITSLQDQERARQALIAARQEKGVQSEQQIQADWLDFIRRLPLTPPSHALHQKAINETIVRLYSRAIQDLEHSLHVLQRQQQHSSSGGNQQAYSGFF